jgi:beta-barrel assembly-enhancing protease
MKTRLVALALFLAGCAVVFVLQRQKATVPISPRPLLYLVADTEQEAERIPLALTRVSDQEEIEVGDKLARKYGLVSRRQGQVELVISGYLNSVGSRVARGVQRKDIPYHFYLQDNPYFVNAYALPGGHVVVGRGLLKILGSEDELAAVLGHEIVHVDNRHAIGHLQYLLLSQKLGLDDVYQIASPAVTIFEAGYTKDQEFEADRVGLGLAVAAGYSPMGGVNLMTRFEKMEGEYSEHEASPIDEAAGMPWSSIVEYFRSHPPAAERRAQLEKEIRISDWNTAEPLRPLAIASLLKPQP